MLIHAATDNDIHPPLFGGTQRAFGLYRGLARRHEVHALCVVPNRTAAPAEENVAGVRLLRRKAWYTSLAWRLERARLAPMFTAAYGHALAARALARAFPARPMPCWPTSTWPACSTPTRRRSRSTPRTTSSWTTSA
jgi:hypothetical protein